MNADEKARLIGNLVAAMQAVSREIPLRQIRHFNTADPSYGAGVAQGLGIEASAATAA